MANTPLRLLTTTLRPSPEIATASASSVRLSVSQSRRRTEKHQRHFSLPAVQSVSRSPVFITLVVRPPVCAGFGPEASFARSLSLPSETARAISPTVRHRLYKEGEVVVEPTQPYSPNP